jgi:predicted 2-oxoglutarate/Fe(II)-dependent dioxygenase YbiX
MSQHFLHIPALLNPQELDSILSLSSNAEFVDGKLTASMAAKESKIICKFQLLMQRWVQYIAY